MNRQHQQQHQQHRQQQQCDRKEDFLNWRTIKMCARNCVLKKDIETRIINKSMSILDTIKKWNF